MKIKNLLLSLISAVILGGCANNWNIVPVNASDYKKHQLLFEVAYNFSCVAAASDHVWQFKKGQRFQPVVFGGRTLLTNVSKAEELMGAKKEVVLPKNTLGLHFATINSKVSVYFIINPDGQFASNKEMILLQNNQLWASFEKNNCADKKGQVPFKSISNK